MGQFPRPTLAMFAALGMVLGYWGHGHFQERTTIQYIEELHEFQG